MIKRVNGEELRARRRELGLKQTELGERLGLTQATISAIELGKDEYKGNTLPAHIIIREGLLMSPVSDDEIESEIDEIELEIASRHKDIEEYKTEQYRLIDEEVHKMYLKVSGKRNTIKRLKELSAEREGLRTQAILLAEERVKNLKIQLELEQQQLTLLKA